LYRRIYEEFRGKQLPPRPHGLEQAFVKIGVAPKQAEAARTAFDKSAKLAGFFSAGEDRLIEPITGAPVMSERPIAEDPPAAENGPLTVEMTGKSSKKYSGLHPFIQGLLDTLPAPETNWTVEGRAKWLQAAAHCFDLIYMGSGEIRIEATPSQQQLPTARKHRQFTGDPDANKSHVDDEITSY
jgi:hypothetical protein